MPISALEQHPPRVPIPTNNDLQTPPIPLHRRETTNQLNNIVSYTVNGTAKRGCLTRFGMALSRRSIHKNKENNDDSSKEQTNEKMMTAAKNEYHGVPKQHSQFA